MKKKHDDEVIEVVEAEIVDALPDNSTLVIPVMSEVPEAAVPAPSPNHWERPGGYFVKGGRPGPGHPRIYDDPEKMEKACREYFASCQGCAINQDTGQPDYFWRIPPTIPGLARSIGMDDETLRRYGLNEKFSDIVAWSKGIIKEYLETAANQPGNQSGRIFLMKNLGYSDTKTCEFTAPNRLAAAKSDEEIKRLAMEDVPGLEDIK